MRIVDHRDPDEADNSDTALCHPPCTCSAETSDLQSSHDKHARQPNLMSQRQLKLPNQTDGEANDDEIQQRIGDFDADNEVSKGQTMTRYHRIPGFLHRDAPQGGYQDDTHQPHDTQDSHHEHGIVKCSMDTEQSMK